MAKFKVEEGVRATVDGQSGEVLDKQGDQWRFRSDAGHGVTYVDEKDFGGVDDTAEGETVDAPVEDEETTDEKPAPRAKAKK